MANTQSFQHVLVIGSLIGASATVIVCLVNRLNRTGSVARDNARDLFKYELDRLGYLSKGETQIGAAQLIQSRLNRLNMQNKTLLQRYWSIRIVLAMLCATVIFVVSSVVYTVRDNIKRSKNKLTDVDLDLNNFSELILIALIMILIAVLVAFIEWLGSVDALSHEVSYGNWLTLTDRPAESPKLVRRAVFWIALDYFKITKVFGGSPIHSWAHEGQGP